MTPFYFVARFFCQAFCIIWFRVRVFGRNHVPATGPVILLSNHQSFLDPLLTAMGVPRAASFMARDTLFTNPLFARLIASANAFPVKRGSADIGALKEMLRRLKADKVVLLFPEGTRTTDGKIAPLLPGFVAVAKRTGATIVPVAMEGAFEAWPRWQKGPTPRRIMVQYGEPISAEALASMDNDAIIDHCRRRMIETHNLVRTRMGSATYEG